MSTSIRASTRIGSWTGRRWGGLWCCGLAWAWLALATGCEKPPEPAAPNPDTQPPAAAPTSPETSAPPTVTPIESPDNSPMPSVGGPAMPRAEFSPPFQSPPPTPPPSYPPPAAAEPSPGAAPSLAPAAGPMVELSAGVALPQTGPTGWMMSFSVDYEFTQGGPDPTSKYGLVIQRAGGQPTISQVQLRERDTLRLSVPEWRKEEGPFQAQLIEVRSDGSRRAISALAELAIAGED